MEFFSVYVAIVYKNTCLYRTRNDLRNYPVGGNKRACWVEASNVPWIIDSGLEYSGLLRRLLEFNFIFELTQ